MPFLLKFSSAFSGVLVISIPSALKKSVLPQALVIEELVCLITLTPHALAVIDAAVEILIVLDVR